MQSLSTASLKTQLRQLQKTLQPLLRHVVFATMLLSICFLIYVAYSVTQILNKPSDDAYRLSEQAKVTQTKFDQSTINLVLGLKLTTDPSSKVTFNDFSVKRTRLNPFTE